MKKITKKTFTEEEINKLLPHMKTDPTKWRSHLWKTGQSIDLKVCRKRWLLARCQARYWNQEWSISWEEWQDITLNKNVGGTTPNSFNVCRIDPQKGWHKDNVMIMPRNKVIERGKSKDANGNIIKRVRKKDLVKYTEDLKNAIQSETNNKKHSK